MAGKKPLPASTPALKTELAAVTDVAVAMNDAMLQARTVLSGLKDLTEHISMVVDMMATARDPEAERPHRLLLTAAEVGNVLGMSESTVWRRTGDGSLPKPVRLGGATRWRWTDIKDAVARLRSEGGDAEDLAGRPEEDRPSSRKDRGHRT